MRVLVTELLVARIVQWMLRPAAVVLWLGTLIVSLHSQPVPPPPSPAQIKDVQIPKLTSPPRIEQFLGGASRADLRRIDDFRQRQPGDGVPVSRKTSAWIGYDDRNFYAGEMFSRPVILASCGVKPEIPAFRGKTEFRPGLDAKAVIHDTLTLVDPEFGGRITGKLGQWDLGVLAIDDPAAGAALDPADPNYGGRAEIGVVRLQREFGKSNVGFLVTDRQFAGSYNRVASLDTRLKFNDTWTFTNARPFALAPVWDEWPSPKTFSLTDSAKGFQSPPTALSSSAGLAAALGRSVAAPQLHSNMLDHKSSR